MPSIYSSIADFGRMFIEFIWFPVLVWTLFSLLALLFLRFFKTVHSQYQYDIRLALLIALPAGMAVTFLIEGFGSHFFPGDSADESLKFISVVSPIEVGIVSQDETSGLSWPLFLYAAMTLTAFTGMAFMLARYAFQCVQLYVLKKKSRLHPIDTVDGLNLKNLHLAASTGKTVRIGIARSDIIPVTFGFRKPVILLPPSLLGNPDKMNLAVRHELMHICKNDFVTHLMVTFIKAQFWFHPVVHLLSKQLIDYREMRCDSFVLSDETVSRKEYASLLLELLPMPNIDKQISVNMAQESSNLKLRVQMITQLKNHKPIPLRSSLSIFAALLTGVVLAMACTDMQAPAVFDNEELDLMTDVDDTGERGYHQIMIFMGDAQQAERHQDLLDQLGGLQPEHIESIDVLKGENAIDAYGERASEGVIVIQTNLTSESYNTTLQALGMEPVALTAFSGEGANTDEEDYFVVVEEMPELIGGLEQIQQTIRYPEMARRAGIEGRVYVQFIVNEEGDVENPRVIRGIGGGADEEAVRAVSLAKFKPGLQRGRPVRVQYSLPIFFRLAGSPQAEAPETVSKTMEVQLNRSNNNIEGTVLDSETGQPLAGANIILPGTNQGSATNMDGEFALSNIDAETSELQVSYIGFQTAVVNL